MDSKQDKLQLVSDGRYQIPKFKSSITYQTNPFENNTALMNKWMDWTFQFSLLSKDHYDKKIRCTSVMAGSYVYPFCKDIRRFERLVKWVASLFTYDDYLDLCSDEEETRRMIEDTLKCIKRLEAIYVRGEQDKNPILGFKPFVVCAYLIVEDILLDSNIQQRKRFLNLWKSYCVGSYEEKEVIEKQILDLNEINRIRLQSGAMFTMFALIQYSQQIFIPDVVWEDKKFQRLMELCNLCTIFVNDVYSFEKEYVEQNEDMSKLIVNVVGFHVLKYKCSIQTAIEKSLDMIREHESKYKELADSFINDPTVSVEVKTFIKCLTAVNSGIFGYSIHCKRYNNIYGV